MISEFWQGKRVLITGHTGFKGAWLSLWLSHLQAKVYGYALEFPTRPSLFEVAGVADNLTQDTRADILDLDCLHSAFAEAQPDIVFHLAAQSLVREGYHDPVQTYATNVMGTVHVLEAIRKQPSVCAAIMVTTDKCYQNREWEYPYREIDRLGGHDPYSNSKACAELAVQAYRSSFFMTQDKTPAAIATVRAGNVIGGGDWAEDRLIPDCIRAFAQNQPVTLRYPDAVRPWQHVFEPLAGYLLLMEKLYGTQRTDYAKAWNFGPEPVDELPVREIAGLLAQTWGADANVREQKGEHPHEAGLLRLDSSLAKALLNWKPRWQLARAVAETAHWYRAWQQGSDMQAFSRQQINVYMAGT